MAEETTLTGEEQGNTENTGGDSNDTNAYETLKTALPEDLQGHATHETFDSFVKDYADLKAAAPVVPESPDAYVLDFGEDMKPFISEETIAKFKQGAFEQKFTQSQVDFLKAFDSERFAAGKADFEKNNEQIEQFKQIQEQQQEREEYAQSLKAKWGDKYDQKIDGANKAFKIYLDAEGIGADKIPEHERSSPYFQEILSVLSEKFSEDTFIEGGSTPKTEKVDAYGSPLLFNMKG